MVNGIPIIGHQGKGSIADLTIQRLLTLQGTMKPDQIISLMTFEGADNTLAMGDHDDHIHVGWKPLYGTNSKAAKQVNAVLKPKQWIKLIDRLKEIDNPEVRLQPSKYAVKTVRARVRRAPRRVPRRGARALLGCERLVEAVQHPLLALAHALGVAAHEAALLRRVRGLLRGLEQPLAHRCRIVRRGLLGDDAG